LTLAAAKKRLLSEPNIDDRTLSYLGVGALTLIYFLGIARLNPDPHHDGVQFAAAVGIADGLNIHSQVFQQYGLVGAWIQGATLDLFGATLLNLRIENAVLLTIAALLLLRICLLLRIPKTVSVLLCLVWAVSCPVSSVTPGSFGFWPWSSVFALVFLLANAAVLLNSQIKRRNLTDWEIYLAGLTCAVIIFTRFQVGAAAALVNLVLIGVGLGRSSIADRNSRLWKFLLSLSIGVGFFMGVLAIQGSIPSFFEQIISGPLRQYTNPFDWNFFKLYYVLGSLPTLIAVLLMALAWRHLKGDVRTVAVGLIGLALGSLMYFGNWRDSAYLNKFPTWNLILDVQGIGLLFASVAYFLILGFFAICFFFTRDFQYPAIASGSAFGETIKDAYLVFGKTPKGVSRYSTPAQYARRQKMAVLGTLLMLEIPFIIQFYPIADVYHLWWAVPLFLVLVPYTLANFASRRGVKVIMSSILVPALISSTVMFVGLIKVPRIEITEGALKGMQIEGRYVASYAALDPVLRDLPPRSTQFFCRDGLISTWNGSYVQVDASYVNWAWVLPGQEITNTPSRIFVCGAKEYADSFAASRGLRVISAGIPFSLSYWSNDTLFELAP